MKVRALIACVILGLIGSLAATGLSLLSNPDAVKAAVQGTFLVAGIATVFLWKLVDEISKMESFKSTDIERNKLTRERCERRSFAPWIKFAIYLLAAALVPFIGALSLEGHFYLLIVGFLCGCGVWAGLSMVRDYFFVKSCTRQRAEWELRQKQLDEFRPKETANGH